MMTAGTESPQKIFYDLARNPASMNLASKVGKKGRVWSKITNLSGGKTATKRFEELENTYVASLPNILDGERVLLSKHVPPRDRADVHAERPHLRIPR